MLKKKNALNTRAWHKWGYRLQRATFSSGRIYTSEKEKDEKNVERATSWSTKDFCIVKTKVSSTQECYNNRNFSKEKGLLLQQNYGVLYIKTCWCCAYERAISTSSWHLCHSFCYHDWDTQNIFFLFLFFQNKKETDKRKAEVWTDLRDSVEVLRKIFTSKARGKNVAIPRALMKQLQLIEWCEVMGIKQLS